MAPCRPEKALLRARMCPPQKWLGTSLRQYVLGRAAGLRSSPIRGCGLLQARPEKRSHRCHLTRSAHRPNNSVASSAVKQSPRVNWLLCAMEMASLGQRLGSTCCRERRPQTLAHGGPELQRLRNSLSDANNTTNRLPRLGCKPPLKRLPRAGVEALRPSLRPHESRFGACPPSH